MQPMYFVKTNQSTNIGLHENGPKEEIFNSNIGDAHRLMGDFQKALELHPKALDIQANINCTPRILCNNTRKFR